MAQQKADSPEVIYDILTEDEEFIAMVGSYDFVGQTGAIDSISISSPNQPLPQLSKQTGLEVIIHDVGQVERMDYITSETEALISWKVYLIAWPPANGLTVTNAAARIIKIFSNSTAIDIISVPNEIGALIQSVVLIPKNAAIMV